MILRYPGFRVDDCETQHCYSHTNRSASHRYAINYGLTCLASSFSYTTGGVSMTINNKTNKQTSKSKPLHIPSLHFTYLLNPFKEKETGNI